MNKPIVQQRYVSPIAIVAMPALIKVSLVELEETRRQVAHAIGRNSEVLGWSSLDWKMGSSRSQSA